MMMNFNDNEDVNANFSANETQGYNSVNRNPIANDENVIDLTPSEYVDTDQQEETENPVIIIERDGHDVINNQKLPLDKRTLWKRIGIGLVVLVAVLLCAYAGWRYYYHHYYVGMPVSCTSSENIAKLERPASANVKPQVIMTQDSIGTVALNMYQLCGLKAEISFDEPDSLDQSVYFYSRCADYGKDGKVIGSMVIDGKEISDDNNRLGYCAMVGNNTVIGIARDEKVRDYAEENGGGFFRQFILVSNGEIPTVFHLHKKVERRALARMDDQIYYIESRHAETMWDFADAIRKYGFIDAIYITGGDQPSFYRTSDGERHLIGNPKSAPSDRNKKFAPYIIFKKR